MKRSDTENDPLFENVTVAQYNDINGGQRIGEDTANNQKTIEDVVNDIAGKPTISSVILVVLAMFYGLSVDSLTYITVFTGFGKHAILMFCN